MWRAFVANLLFAVSSDNGPVFVFIALRADCYDRQAAGSRFAEVLLAQHLLAGPLTRDEMRRRIEYPARNAGVEFELGWSNCCSRSSGTRPVPCPSRADSPSTGDHRDGHPDLGPSLPRSWRAHRRAHPPRGGGLLHLLPDPREQEICRRIFLRLVQPGDESEDTPPASLREIPPSGPCGQGGRGSCQAAGRPRVPAAHDRTGEPAADDGTLEGLHEGLDPQLAKAQEVDRHRPPRSTNSAPPHRGGRGNGSEPAPEVRARSSTTARG